MLRSMIALGFLATTACCLFAADDQSSSATPEGIRPAEPLRLADEILDDKRSEADRKKIIADHPQISLALINAMVSSMPANNPTEEYRRIPWIWRVAVAAGKRNHFDEVRGILSDVVPQPLQPLKDWQAVVIGGGIINGITLSGAWPDEQINRILARDPGLMTRWHDTLNLAATMADNVKVFKGTRYDALRILGADRWETRGGQLFDYLLKGVDEELQQGAIGGMSDMRSPCVGQALISGFAHYNAENRGFVFTALLRDPVRTAAFLDAIEAGTIKPADIDASTTARLKSHRDPALRARAAKLLTNPPASRQGA